jgi:hypothetical protein
MTTVAPVGAKWESNHTAMHMGNRLVDMAIKHAIMELSGVVAVDSLIHAGDYDVATTDPTLFDHLPTVVIRVARGGHDGEPTEYREATVRLVLY